MLKILLSPKSPILLKILRPCHSSSQESRWPWFLLQWQYKDCDLHQKMLFNQEKCDFNKEKCDLTKKKLYLTKKSCDLTKKNVFNWILHGDLSIKNVDSTNKHGGMMGIIRLGIQWRIIWMKCGGTLHILYVHTYTCIVPILTNGYSVLQ